MLIDAPAKELLADLLIKHGRRAAIPTKSVTVRLPVIDIDRARQIASRNGTVAGPSGAFTAPVVR